MQDEEEDFDEDDVRDENVPLSKAAQWKPAKFVSFETIVLTSTKLNPSIRPAGFRKNGVNRQIKSTCMLGRMKKLSMLRNKMPKMAVCITMYNEDESELKTTISGVLQNYNAMYMDPNVNLRQQDFVVVLVCDGYERIPESFKKYATEN